MGEVRGQSDPRVDIPAVQTEVNLGGEVILIGNFDFGASNVKVARQVEIRGKNATIVGGVNPFQVGAQTDSFSIEAVKFTRPLQFAILVESAQNATILNCEIADVIPIFTETKDNNGNVVDAFYTAAGIVIGAGVSGDVTVRKNRMSIGSGTKDPKYGVDRTLGILFNKAGKGEISADISENDVSTVTGFGVDVRDFVGQVSIRNNSVSMGEVGVGKPGFTAGIRCLRKNPTVVRNENPCVVSHNVITCGFNGATGIRLLGAVAANQLNGVRIEHNEIMLDGKSSTVDPFHAGIEIRGNCRGNEVTDNKLKGAGFAALSVLQDTGLTPSDNTFAGNHFEAFTSGPADVSVGKAVANTRIIARNGTQEVTADGRDGTVSNLGLHTIVDGDFLMVP